jgi:hypothetical protein
VNIFCKSGNAAITEGDDVTRIITAYGKDGYNKTVGCKVVPGTAINPDGWAGNPSFHEVK